MFGLKARVFYNERWLCGGQRFSDSEWIRMGRRFSGLWRLPVVLFGIAAWLVLICIGSGGVPVLCRNLHPCQIMHPLLEIATWLPNPNPTPNPNPSPTPNPKPTNTRGCIIWQGAEFGTTPALLFFPLQALEIRNANKENFNCLFLGGAAKGLSTCEKTIGSDVWTEAIQWSVKTQWRATKRYFFFFFKWLNLKAEGPETLFHIRSNLLCLLCQCVVSFLFDLRCIFHCVRTRVVCESCIVCRSWQQ